MKELNFHENKNHTNNNSEKVNTGNWKSVGSSMIHLTSASHVSVTPVPGMSQLTPCEHMKKVKTMKSGWLSGWKGTWKGALYTHPEAPDNMWYHLIVTGPTSPNCQCLRLVPVPVPKTDSVDPVKSGTSLPITTTPGTLTSGKTLVDRKAGNQKFSFTYWDTDGDTKDTDRPEWGFGESKDMSKHMGIFLKKETPSQPKKVSRRSKLGKEKEARREKAMRWDKIKKTKAEAKEKTKLGWSEPKINQVNVNTCPDKKDSSMNPVPAAFVLDLDEVVRVLEHLLQNSYDAFVFDLEDFVSDLEVLLPPIKSSQEKVIPRRRGGANGDSDYALEDMLEAKKESAKINTDRAIKVAAQLAHSVKLRHIVPNLADGNCALESVCDQLNSTRSGEFLGLGSQKFPTPSTLRDAVVQCLRDNKEIMTQFGFWGTKSEWENELRKLQQNGVWDTQAGDLVIPAVAMVTKKNILIYKTRPTYTACGKFPIDVVMASTLGGEVDTEIPLVLCYTGDHYEGLVPCTEEDVVKTVEIVHEWNRTGSYTNTVLDIPVLREQFKLEEIREMEEKWKCFKNVPSPHSCFQELGRTRSATRTLTTEKDNTSNHASSTSPVASYAAKA